MRMPRAATSVDSDVGPRATPPLGGEGTQQTSGFVGGGRWPQWPAGRSWVPVHVATDAIDDETDASHIAIATGGRLRRLQPRTLTFPVLFMQRSLAKGLDSHGS